MRNNALDLLYQILSIIKKLITTEEESLIEKLHDWKID